MNKQGHYIISIRKEWITAKHSTYLKSYQPKPTRKIGYYVHLTTKMEDAKVYKTKNGAIRVVQNVLKNHYVNDFSYTIEEVSKKVIRMAKLKELEFYE